MSADLRSMPVPELLKICNDLSDPRREEAGEILDARELEFWANHSAAGGAI